MLYEINKKYYVKVGSLYNEVKIDLDKNGEVVLIPLKNKIEARNQEIRPFAFEAEKDKFKRKLTQRSRYERIKEFE